MDELKTNYNNYKANQELINYYEKKLKTVNSCFIISSSITIILVITCIVTLFYSASLYKDSLFNLTENIGRSINTMKDNPDLIPIIQIIKESSESVISKAFESLNNLYILIFSILGAGMITVSLNLFKIKNEYEEKLELEKAKGIKLEVKKIEKANNSNVQ